MRYERQQQRLAAATATATTAATTTTTTISVSSGSPAQSERVPAIPLLSTAAPPASAVGAGPPDAAAEEAELSELAAAVDAMLTRKKSVPAPPLRPPPLPSLQCYRPAPPALVQASPPPSCADGSEIACLYPTYVFLSLSRQLGAFTPTHSALLARRSHARRLLRKRQLAMHQYRLEKELEREEEEVCAAFPASRKQTSYEPPSVLCLPHPRSPSLLLVFRAQHHTASLPPRPPPLPTPLSWVVSDEAAK